MGNWTRVDAVRVGRGFVFAGEGEGGGCRCEHICDWALV